MRHRWNVGGAGAAVPLNSVGRSSARSAPPARTAARSPVEVRQRAVNQVRRALADLAAARAGAAADWEPTIEAVAERSGLGTPANLRKQFRRHLGTAPSAYRATFTTRPKTTNVI